MKLVLSSFVAGLVFTLGLSISGMTNADSVIGFLNVFNENWDPSLAFVLMTAVVVHAVLFRLTTKRASPIFGIAFGIPTRKDIDARLVVGAILFGAGWGISGFCPGPALAAVSSMGPEALLFTLSMVSGMLIFHTVDNKIKHLGQATSSPTATKAS